MKLVLTKPKKNTIDYQYEELLYQGLFYEDIYIGNHVHGGNKEFSVSWNDVYDFYDISLFPILGNPSNPTKQFEEFEQWLIDNKYKYETQYTWTWWNRKKYGGVRFMVYPKKG